MVKCCFSFLGELSFISIIVFLWLCHYVVVSVNCLYVVVLCYVVSSYVVSSEVLSSEELK